MPFRIPAVPPAALAGGAVAVGFGGLYLAGLLISGGEIESGTTVRGIDIGGLSPQAAEEKLTKELAASDDKPFPVTIGDRTAAITPRDAGFSVDVAATVDRAARNGADPITAIGGLFSSGGEVEPVATVDEDQTRAALQRLAKTHDQKVRDGRITFAKGEVKEVAPRTGHALDVDAATDALRKAYLDASLDASGGLDSGGKQSSAKKPAANKPGSDPDALALPTRETEPKVGKAETERALRTFARPAMSAPITLTAAGQEISVTPTTLAKHLSMKVDKADNSDKGDKADKGDGKQRLVPRLDAKGLLADPEVAGPLQRITGKVENAKLRLAGDRVVADTPGSSAHQVTDKALRKAVMPLLTKSGAQARTGAVSTVETRPKVTSANAAELGIKEEMSSFTVNFEPAEYRTKNIGRAAELINGSVVLPGENWSFNETVGERTKANGFVDGTIILNDKYTKASGGGVSAVATTMFNAVFFAGVKPVEYGAHSFYIERYPEGREATVAWGSLDLKFNNDSGNAIYIQASATDTSVTISFLGTKKYDEIESVTGPRTNVKEPSERKGDPKQCEPQTPLEGFDVEVERVFKQNGAEVKREPFQTHYTPRDKVTCDDQPTDEATDEATDAPADAPDDAPDHRPTR